MVDRKELSQAQSPEEWAMLTVRALDEAACNYAHSLYWEKEFQTLARLTLLDQGEQDRIFNELVVANIVLIMLVAEAPDLRTPDEFKGFLREIQKCMPKAHAEYLGTLGVKSKHLKDWKKLIDMRFR